MSATRDEIVHRFLELLAARQINLDNGIDVDDDTYINGIPVRVDHDYYQGHLLEIVERETGVVSYVAVAEFHGPRIDHRCDCDLDPGCEYCGGTDILAFHWDHDSMWYEPDCGTFFERTDAADSVTVGKWAVFVIYGMMDSYAEAQRAVR